MYARKLGVKMTVSDLSATLEIAGGYQGGMEPWAHTSSIRIGPKGFHGLHVGGDAGDDRTFLTASDIGSMLLTQFDRVALLALLDSLLELRATLME